MQPVLSLFCSYFLPKYFLLVLAFAIFFCAPSGAKEMSSGGAGQSGNLGMPRKRRAPDRTEADVEGGEDDAVSLPMGATGSSGAALTESGAGASAASGPASGSSIAGLGAASKPSSAGAMTPSEVDAAIAAELAKKYPAGLEARCEDQAERLREATYVLPGLVSGDPDSFDADDALIAALRHGRIDVVRHGARALRWLAEGVPAAVLRMLQDDELGLLAAVRAAVATADAEACGFMLEGLRALTKDSGGVASAGAGSAGGAATAVSAIASLVGLGAVDVVVTAAQHALRSSVDCAISTCALLYSLVEHISSTAAPREARLPLMRALIAAGAPRVAAICIAAFPSDLRVAGPAVRVLRLLVFDDVAGGQVTAGQRRGVSPVMQEADGQLLIHSGACEAAIAVCRVHVHDYAIKNDACHALQFMAWTHSAVARQLVKLGAPQALAAAIERWPPAALSTSSDRVRARDSEAPLYALLFLTAAGIDGSGPSGCDMSPFAAAIVPLVTVLRSTGGDAKLAAMTENAAFSLSFMADVVCSILELIARDSGTHAVLAAVEADVAVTHMLNGEVCRAHFCNVPAAALFLARLAERSTADHGECMVNGGTIETIVEILDVLADLDTEAIVSAGISSFDLPTANDSVRACCRLLLALADTDQMYVADRHRRVFKPLTQVVDRSPHPPVGLLAFDPMSASFAVATIAKLCSRSATGLLTKAARANTVGTLLRFVNDHAKDTESAARAAAGLRSLCSASLPGASLYLRFRGACKSLCSALRYVPEGAAPAARRGAATPQRKLVVACLQALAALASHAFNRPSLVAGGAVEAVLAAAGQHLDDIDACAAACGALEHLLLADCCSNRRLSAGDAVTAASAASAATSLSSSSSSWGEYAFSATSLTSRSLSSSSSSTRPSVCLRLHREGPIRLLLEVLLRHAGNATVEASAFRALCVPTLEAALPLAACLGGERAGPINNFTAACAAAVSALQRKPCAPAARSSASLLLQLVNLTQSKPLAGAATEAGAGTGAGAGHSSASYDAGFASSASTTGAEWDLSRDALVAEAQAASMQAAVCGGSDALEALADPRYASAVRWDVVLGLAASIGHQASVDVILAHVAVSATESFPRDLDDALLASITHGHEDLSEHLLHVWQPETARWASSRGLTHLPFWAAAGARSVRTLDALVHQIKSSGRGSKLTAALTEQRRAPVDADEADAADADDEADAADAADDEHNEDDGTDGAEPAAAAAASLPDHLVVSCSADSGEFQLLQDLLADPRLDSTLLPCLGAGDAHSREAARATRVAIIQRMLLDPRADVEAAGNDALAAAAAGGHISILEALLEDLRVDGTSFAVAELTERQPKADSVTDRMLMRQPSVLRALALPIGEAGPIRPYVPTSADLAAIAVAAWRRRRPVVLAHWTSLQTLDWTRSGASAAGSLRQHHVASVGLSGSGGVGSEVASSAVAVSSSWRGDGDAAVAGYGWH